MDAKIYIANDVEAAGDRLGHHPTLSVGACVVTRDKVSFEEAIRKNLVFYAELKPDSLEYVTDNMRVGALCLKCLEGIRDKDSRYDPSHDDFDPLLVLKHMQRVCEEPSSAMKRFESWIRQVSDGRKVEGVTNTVFFDGGRIDLAFGQNVEKPPYWHKGIDLDSLYRGYARRSDARLSELREFGGPEESGHTHRADQDAHFIAGQARVLMYELLGW